MVAIMSHKVTEASRPNVILFLYDSLIASMLSCFGGSAPTPAFDFFANGGARFQKTAAHSLRSDVAMGTILTGLYPHHSGIHKLITDNNHSSAKIGYLYKDENNLPLTAYWSGYRVRIFNCEELNHCMISASRHNLPLAAPHLDQLMHFVNESGQGPFLLVDRFKTTGFGWHHGLPRDRRDSDAELRELALQGLGAKNSRPLIIRRMQDAAMKEDARLMRIINLMHRHSLMEKTIVVIAGIPDDLTEAEAEALAGLDGSDKQNIPLFPTIFWSPPRIAPAVIDDAAIRHIDIAPTLISISGMTAAYDMDGLDLLPSLKDGRPFGEESLTFYDDRITLSANGSSSTLALPPADSPETKPAAENGSSRILELLDNPKTAPKRNDPLLGKHAIQKSTIFFLGVPRSGTTFFSKFFQRREFSNVECKGKEVPQPLNNINTLYDSGIIDREKVKSAIGALKNEIMSYRKETLVVVSHDLYAIIPLLAELFVNSKFIFIARDPRTFVTSASSIPKMAPLVKSNTLHQPESLMQPWQKLICNDGWVGKLSLNWNNIARKHHDEAQKLGKRALTLRFEDVFDRANGYPGMKKIARFLKNEIRIPDNDGWLKSVFQEKVYSFNYSFPEWKEWGTKDKETLLHSCGETMALLGYDADSNP